MAEYHNRVGDATKATASNDTLKAFLTKARNDASILKSLETFDFPRG